MTEEEKKNTEDAASNQNGGEEQPKKKSWVKRIIITLVILIVVGLGLVVLGPTIVTSGPGQGIIKSQVNSRVPGKVEWSNLSLGWANTLLLEEVVYEDAERPLTIRIDSIESDGTLTDFLTNGGAFKIIPISEIEVDLVLPADGSDATPTPTPKEVADEALGKVNDMIKQLAQLWNSGLGLQEKVTIDKITVRIIREKGETETVEVELSPEAQSSINRFVLPGGTILEDHHETVIHIHAYRIELERQEENNLYVTAETATWIQDFRHDDGRVERFAVESSIEGTVQGKA